MQAPEFKVQLYTHQLIELLQIASQVIMLVYHTKLLSVMDSMSRDFITGPGWIIPNSAGTSMLQHLHLEFYSHAGYRPPQAQSPRPIRFQPTLTRAFLEK